MTWRIFPLALVLAGCAMTLQPPEGLAPPSGAVAASSLDELARRYVQLQLEIGQQDEGYIDAYYGPPEWREAAGHQPRSLADLALAVDALGAEMADIPASAEPLERRRLDFLRAQLTAARTRLRMLRGERLSFAEEALDLFGAVPDIRPLSDYDPALARIDRLVPGGGDLAERVEAFQSGFAIPRDRLDAVMRAAIDECRRRTLRHIPLPGGESFDLEFVTDKSWSGYNWYQGRYRSLIQVNTDLPVRLDRAVDLGCHEGYPGHHAHNALLEQKLARRRGWVEFMVYPLYSPQSFIAEGSANYGIELAFPGRERLEFETRILYPLAGLPTERAVAYLALQHALAQLSGARFTIARDYLEGRLSRERAIALTQRYQLVSRERAEQSIAFTHQYRAYVVNYGLGRDMVARHIESAGSEPSARWAAMERLLSEPTLPSDLEPLP